MVLAQFVVWVFLTSLHGRARTWRNFLPSVRALRLVVALCDVNLLAKLLLALLALLVTPMPSLTGGHLFPRHYTICECFF